MEKETLFPFGFGLSYSNFEYSNLKVESASKGEVIASVTITNNGKYDAEEVAQLYTSSPMAGEGDPLYSLIAFQRVAIPVGKTKYVRFELDKKAFMEVNEEGKRLLRKGDYNVWAGGSLPGARSEALGTSKWLVIPVNVMKLLK